jgi:hypothetical protein
MFSLAHALPSPISAEGCPSLFGWFIGTMAQSDSSRAYTSDVRFCIFSDRPRLGLIRGTLEVSRFSCMLFLSVRGFSDYAGSTGHSRLTQPAMLPSSCCRESRHPVLRLFEAQSPRPLIPLSTLRPAPRDADRKTQGQDGVAFSFLVGLFHSQQHAGFIPALLPFATTECLARRCHCATIQQR